MLRICELKRGVQLLNVYDNHTDQACGDEQNKDHDYVHYDLDYRHRLQVYRIYWEEKEES